MFKFFANSREMFRKNREKARLKAIGIIVEKQQLADILYEQLIGGKKGKELKNTYTSIKTIFEKLKVSLPITITKLSNSKQSQQSGYNIYMYETATNAILRVNSSIKSFDKFEIGVSKDGKKFTCIGLQQRYTVLRLINESYQYETIMEGSYLWTYVSNVQKISIVISGGTISSLIDFKELSSSLLTVNTDFKKILEIVKKFTKTNNKNLKVCATIALEENNNDLCKTYIEKQKVTVEAGKTIKYHITEPEYCFSYSLIDGEEWEIIKNISVLDQGIKTKGKYSVRLHYSKKNKYMCEVKANITPSSRENAKDVFGVLELIENAENTIGKHLAGIDQVSTTLNVKTATYFIEFSCGNRWRYETNNSRIVDFKSKLKYNVMYNSENGWKVSMYRIFSKHEDIQQFSGVLALEEQANQIIRNMK